MKTKNIEWQTNRMTRKQTDSLYYSEVIHLVVKYISWILTIGHKPSLMLILPGNPKPSGQGKKPKLENSCFHVMYL